MIKLRKSKKKNDCEAKKASNIFFLKSENVLFFLNLLIRIHLKTHSV